MSAFSSVAVASVAMVIGAGSIPESYAGEPEGKAKDAAEAVGEGNASRWLDFYRRERGQSWEAAPAAGNARGTTPAQQPDVDSGAAPEASAQPSPERR